MSSPFLIILSLISWLSRIRHLMFMVRSSSLERGEEEESLRLGRMQTGGIGRSWVMKEVILVRPETFSRSHSR
jgi:hypothetical protein